MILQRLSSISLDVILKNRQTNFIVNIIILRWFWKTSISIAMLIKNSSLAEKYYLGSNRSSYFWKGSKLKVVLIMNYPARFISLREVSPELATKTFASFKPSLKMSMN